MITLLEKLFERLPLSVINTLQGPAVEDSVIIVIPDKPVPKGRPRYTRQGRCYTPKQTLQAEQLVKAVALTQLGSIRLQGALGLELLTVFPVPVSWSKKKRAAALRGEIRPACKPDFDNLAKLYCDALNGLLWEDDKQVVDGRCIKCYGVDPAVVIWCWKVE